jgi:hypothetical protein
VSDTSSESSSSEDEEENEKVEENIQKPQNTPTPVAVAKSKKRKLEEDANDSTTASTATTPTKSAKQSAEKPVPFKRVRAEEVEFLDNRLRDNSFMGKSGGGDTYGMKAHQDLIVTRGKGFTKEKNKKKRGSYKGGKIDVGSHSIKFANSSDDE